MLKAFGCICILLASSGMAYTCVLGLSKELHQTELLLEILTAMEGEITYNRCPLPELLMQMSGRLPKPYAELFMQAGNKMEDNSEADIPLLWKNVCAQFYKQLALPVQAYQILLRIGEVFTYSSLESSLQLMRLSREKLTSFIKTRHAEFSGKRKLYCCLCYSAGLFSIIILL